MIRLNLKNNTKQTTDKASLLLIELDLESKDQVQDLQVVLCKKELHP